MATQDTIKFTGIKQVVVARNQNFATVFSTKHPDAISMSGYAAIPGSLKPTNARLHLLPQHSALYCGGRYAFWRQILA
jgi:hypothetical protein